MFNAICDVCRVQQATTIHNEPPKGWLTVYHRGTPEVTDYCSPACVVTAFSAPVPSFDALAGAETSTAGPELSIRRGTNDCV